MSNMGFGDHLVSKGIISPLQLEKVLALQNKSRLLGEIAVEEHYLSPKELTEVVEYMEGRPGIMLGEAAISLGYLSAPQLRYLLDIRTRKKIWLGQLLVQCGYITEESLNSELAGYDTKRRKLKKIMVCEATKTVYKLLHMMLTKYGYEVFEAQTGAEALELAHTKKPDVLLTSNVLKDMDGYALCEALVSDQFTAGIRTILLSSSVTQEEIEQAFEAGANHFLRKPIKESELVNILYLMEREEQVRRPEKILIVDDSAGARMVIHNELSSTWSDINTAKDGAEALEVAKKIKPDLITMDVEMPVMGGLEACRRLKEDPETEDIPVVFITANDTPEFREQGFDAGGSEYFIKPFQPRKLAEFISILLEAKKIRRREKVLIVEDSRTTRHVLKHFFLKNGYTVFIAEDGQEALELLPKTNPDIVVTDCKMPRMDGFALAHRMKAAEGWRRIPIIMLTSFTSKKDILKGFRAGANDYILKPFDESELIARVDSHLRNKALMEQIEMEKEKLRLANEEKDRFLGVAAHDLRNPLGSIIGYASILAEDELSEGTRKKFAAIVHDVSEGMLKLLEELLDITKIESGTVSLSLMPLNIVHTVRYRVSLARIVAEKKGITLNESFPDDLTVTFDQSKMEQVIDNLISNAIKFTQPGRNVYISAVDLGREMKIEVEDEGVGIPDKELSKLFVPFSKLSVKPTGGEKSTGLGLSIAAKIVQAHGGNIGVRSKVGRGSTFHFTIPKHPPTPGTDTKPAP